MCKQNNNLKKNKENFKIYKSSIVVHAVSVL